MKKEKEKKRRANLRDEGGMIRERQYISSGGGII